MKKLTILSIILIVLFSNSLMALSFTGNSLNIWHEGRFIFQKPTVNQFQEASGIANELWQELFSKEGSNTETSKSVKENEDVSKETSSSISIERFSVKPAETRGELFYEVKVTASDPIEKLTIETEVKTETIEVEGTSLQESGKIKAVPGVIGEIISTAVTEKGDQARVKKRQYARKYDMYKGDPSFQFSPHYLLFWDGGRTKTFRRCGVGEPAVGPYSQYPAGDFDREAIERHFDQMQGYGITRVSLNFGESDCERGTLRKYLKHIELIKGMTIDFSYPIIQVIRRNRNMFRDFELMRQVFKKHKVGRIEGRPIVYLWGFGGLYFQKDIRAKIENRYGGIPELVDKINEGLTVNGTKPFLVADIGTLPGGLQEGWNPPDEYMKAIMKCQGVSHWFHPTLNEEKRVDPDKYLENTEEMMQAHNVFALTRNMEYIPVVYPGFDDRANKCWGGDRYVKRSPDLLENTMKLAKKYGTAGFSYLATWNDWAEGTMIEPGTYQNEEFGTDYLKVIRKIQEQS